MISLLIAGGVSVAATSQTTSVTWAEIDNHTLLGETIPASQVVCRNMWGTPMLPDGKGGYSLIAKINPELIRESLIIPPRTTGMVAYRPLPEAEIEARIVTPLPTTTVINSVAPAPAPSDVPPADATAPAPEASPSAPADPTAAPAF